MKQLNKNELMELLFIQEQEIEQLKKRCAQEGVSVGENSDAENLSAELKRTQRRIGSEKRFLAALFRVFKIMLCVAAAAVLVATLYTPVMRVYGTSMEPVLHNGELLVAVKNENLIERGDIVAFYYNDKVLLKRAIGLPGDKVHIDGDGNVFVNDSMLDEPYVSGKSLGACDVSFPMTIPENSTFVLGDHRSVSIDSRSSDIGNVSSERIVGKIVLRVWPLKAFGKVG